MSAFAEGETKALRNQVICLRQWLSMGVTFSNVWTFWIVTTGVAPGLCWVEARDAEHATVHRAAPPQRMTRPVSVPRCRTPVQGSQLLPGRVRI